MTNCPHSPPHRELENGTYMITGGTYNKIKIFDTPDKLTLLQNIIFDTVRKFNFHLEGWAIMNNHYHLVLSFQDETTSFKKFISTTHGISAMELNKLDNMPGRKIWHNYWESKISFQKSYYARLNYVNKNPQHHGIAENAEYYNWCSEAYYKHHLDPAFTKTVDSFKFDKINVLDEFDC